MPGGRPGYPSDVPALAEILGFATDMEGGDGGAAALRYLRPPQLRALET